MGEYRWDIACWLWPSSPDPEIVTTLTVDRYALPFEAVESLMRKRGETYVYKAVVNLGSWPPRRYWHTKLPLREGKAKPPTADEIVKPLWSLLVADGIDPVEIGARDALEQLRLEAANTPDGPLACWCRLALAADVRAFRHEWNARRATEARYRLTRDMET